MSVVLLWQDEFFVLRFEGATVTSSVTFGSASLAGWTRLRGGGVHTYTTAYDEFVARNQGEGRVARWNRHAHARLARTGFALFVVVCVAPLVALVGLARQAAGAAAGYLLLLLAALAPVVAFEFFGRAVAGILDVPFIEDPAEGREGTMTIHASLSGWGARLAWSALAVVIAISWWRWPKPRNATPVDPATFD